MTLADAAAGASFPPEVMNFSTELLKYGLGGIALWLLALQIRPAIEDARRTQERQGQMLRIAILAIEHLDDTIASLKKQIKELGEEARRARQERKNRGVLGGGKVNDPDEEGHPDA